MARNKKKYRHSIRREVRDDRGIKGYWLLDEKVHQSNCTVRDLIALPPEDGDRAIILALELLAAMKTGKTFSDRMKDFLYRRREWQSLKVLDQINFLLRKKFKIPMSTIRALHKKCDLFIAAKTLI